MRNKKNLRRLSVLVTAQTAYHLDQLAAMCGHRDQGRIIGKLVREKMIQMNGGNGQLPGACGQHGHLRKGKGVQRGPGCRPFREQASDEERRLCPAL